MKPFATVLTCLFLALILASSCAPTAIAPEAPPGDDGDVAGFWKGLWHGFIVLFTFLISLFNDGVGVYESYNKGHLYDLGFVLGAMIFFGGSGGGSCRKSKC